MKNSIFIASICTLTLILFACSKKQEHNNVISQSYVHKYGLPLSKKDWEERQKDGKIITKLNTGVIVSSTYTNGVLNGATTYSFPDSEKVAESDLYSDGTLIKKIMYDTEGLPVKEESFELTGKKVITFWDEKGVPISIEEYEEGALQKGEYFTTTHEIEAKVENGNGERLIRDRARVLINKDKVENGIIVYRTTFHPNGNIKSQSSYHNYKLNGESLHYSSSGKLMMKAEWKEGLLHGIKMLFKNGNKTAEIPFVRGQKEGVEKRFDEKGILIAEVHWKTGKKHGSSSSFSDEDTKIEWYFQGIPVSLQKYKTLEYRESLIVGIPKIRDRKLSQIQENE